MLQSPPNISNSPDSLHRLSDKYLHFIQDVEVAAWIANGGELDVATEHQSTDCIETLVKLGQRRFSEKYLQEIESKHSFFEQHDISVQFFGRLQSNKIKRILGLCHTVESISSINQAAAAKHLIGLQQATKRCYIQLNIGHEPQKNGVLPEHAPALIEYCMDIGLPVKGLMCIPPRAKQPAPFFRQMRKLADSFQLPDCQMGFSRDFRVAIREGATSIRIASILFNEHK